MHMVNSTKFEGGKESVENLQSQESQNKMSMDDQASSKSASSDPGLETKITYPKEEV